MLEDEGRVIRFGNRATMAQDQDVLADPLRGIRNRINQGDALRECLGCVRTD